MKKVLKKMLKILAWSAAGIVLLLLILALLINVPAVQLYIINKITISVSSKTHSTVSIGKVGLSFPKSVFLKEVFLDDQHKDTLLYAGEISVDINMIGLIKGNIEMNKVSISDLTANIRRADHDSLFNFSFLVNSFAGKPPDNAVKEKKDSSTSAFSISKVSLENIHLLFDDQYKGLKAKADFAKLDIKTDEIDLKNLKFDIDDVFLSNAVLALTISRKDTSTEKETASVLPVFDVKKLELEKISFSFLNEADSQFISFTTDDFKLKNSKARLSTDQFSVDAIESNSTSFVMSSSRKAKTKGDSLEQQAAAPVLISVNEIALQKTNFRYDDLAEEKLASGFDASHLDVTNLDLYASEAKYSDEGVHSKIKSLSFAGANGFVLNDLSAEVFYTPKESRVKNLTLETVHTKIKGDLECSYSSINAFKDSLQDVFVSAVFAHSYIDPADVIYFVPELSGKPFFMEHSSIVGLEGNVAGEIKNLESKRLIVDGGKNTHIITSFRVKGLPDVDAAFFSIPDFLLRTTQSDLAENLPPSMIPQSIRIPEEVSLNGNFAGSLNQFNAEMALTSSTGNGTVVMKMTPKENYEATVTINEFNAGSLLKAEKTMGKITLALQVKGSGLKKETANATIQLHVASAELNNYRYTNLDLDGAISDQQFTGKMEINDSNIAFAFNGMVGFKPGYEQYKFNLDLKAANLQKLKLTTDDLRLAANLDADLKGSDMDNLNGKAGITKIILVKGEKTYTLDSLLFASVNEKGRSEMSVSSAIIGIKFNGSIAPGKLLPEIINHVNRYFTISDSVPAIHEKNNFSFEVTLHNHPVISEVFLPSLKEFEPGIIEGSFDAEKQTMEIKATVFKLNYDGTVIQDAALHLKSDPEKMSYSLFASEVSNSQLMLDRFDLSGTLKDNKADVALNIGKDEKERKLAFNAAITSPQKGNYRIQFAKDFKLGGSAWNVPDDNEILLPRNGIATIHFALTKGDESIGINSKDSTSTDITFKDFQLINLSRIIQKDTAIAEGKMNGSFSLLQHGAFVSNAQLSNLVIRSHPVGDLSISAKNSAASDIDVDIKLAGNDNNLTVAGTLSPEKPEDALHLRLAVQSISMASIEGFSFGQLQNSSGKITGDISCRGSFNHPILDGQLHFIDVTTTPAAINNPLKLSNETISFTNSGVEFSSFTIRDKKDHTALLNGRISMADFSNPAFDLDLVTNNFLAMNSTAESKQLYYGTVIIDSKIKVTGTPSFPKINADIKLDDGSYFTFAVPETKITADRGEGVVEFTNAKLNPILTKTEKSQSQKTDFRNIDLISDLRIDKNATLKLLIDPASGDSLVVKGEATLSFALDPSGKTSLTGRYELNEGSYLVSLQDLIKKKFEIEKGGTITWNGDPEDADIDIRAIYTVRTSPIDLVANEIGGLSTAQQNTYKERLPFQVILKLKGQLLKPDISFEIQLPPESRGALGGAVYAKLNLLNADESELNKQVFALLVLNRFIQEDPLASAGGNSGAEGVARQSVSRFLSQQLNKMSEEYIKGVELNFDVQSYDDFSTGQREGRTQVEIGLKKQFNPRFSVQVGGSVDVEGESTKQNNASELTGDILVEYKLTDDGRYRLKGFRQTEYEGVIEGQLIETGAGILYTRDFDKWKELFKKPEEEKQ